MARKMMFFDSSKARAALGYAPRPIDDALARAIEFFRSIGAAPAPKQHDGSNRGPA
jgi:dihydroflavonol-4-reductase